MSIIFLKLANNKIMEIITYKDVKIGDYVISQSRHTEGILDIYGFSFKSNWFVVDRFMMGIMNTKVLWLRKERV